MEQELKKIKSKTQRDEYHIYWNDDAWEFPDVREPEIKLHPLGFYNKQFHELKHILDDSSLWDDKKIKTRKQNIILSAFSELQDKASLLESPRDFGNKFSDFIEKNGLKMFIILNKLLGYHVAKIKGEDQSEFLKNHKLVLSSYKTKFVEHEGSFIVEVYISEWNKLTLQNIKLWKEYVWTVAKMPTLTTDDSGLINLPVAEWYNLLFDQKLLKRVMDKKNKFVKDVKELKYKIDIDNPPNIKNIAPPDFEPEAMDQCCEADEDTLLFIFMYLLFPEVGKHVDKINAVKAAIDELYTLEDIGSSLNKIFETLSNKLNMDLDNMKDEIKFILLHKLDSRIDSSKYEFDLNNLKQDLNRYFKKDILDLNREEVLKIFDDRTLINIKHNYIRSNYNNEREYGGLYKFMKKQGYIIGPSSAILLSQVLKKKGIPKALALDYTDKFSDEYQIPRIKDPWRSRKGGGNRRRRWNN